jgi:hypothetical protein
MSAIAQKLGSNIPVPKKSDFVTIVLEDTDRINPTGQFFGINGKNYILRSGEEAKVPRGIVDILDNAIEAHPIKNHANQIVGTRNRHRFPYRVVRNAED